MKRKTKRFDEGGETIDMREDTSQPTGIDEDVRSRAMKYIQSGKKDEETSKPVAKLAPPKSENKVVAKTEDKKEPKVNGKTFFETIAASKSKDQDKPKTKQETAADIAKIQRENIAGPDKNLPAPEPKSAGKRFREFFGSKYKEGGKVAGKLATRGYGKAR